MSLHKYISFLHTYVSSIFFSPETRNIQENNNKEIYQQKTEILHVALAEGLPVTRVTWPYEK